MHGRGGGMHGGGHAWWGACMVGEACMAGGGVGVRGGGEGACMAENKENKTIRSANMKICLKNSYY